MGKILMVLASLVFASAAFAQSASHPENDGLERELIAKSNSVLRALKAKDAPSLDQLLTDDFRMVASEGRISGKRELVGAAREGTLVNFMFYSPELTPIDRGSALLTYNVIVDMPEGDDGPAPRYQKVSNLWVRQEGEWKLKFEQFTPLRPVD
ncbi:MAG: nuclear transport factor 2 family protein [Acidobacteria bacterium]|nr:nuclear transport factor 2 family protein [Acidobacteriota bacterium]